MVFGAWIFGCVFLFSGILPETFFGVCAAQETQSVDQDAEEDGVTESTAADVSDDDGVSEDADAEDASDIAEKKEIAAEKKDSPKAAATPVDEFREKAKVFYTWGDQFRWSDGLYERVLEAMGR